MTTKVSRAIIALALITTARANIINVDLGEPRRIINQQSGRDNLIDLPFAANVSGETLILDFEFSTFVRVPGPSPWFVPGLELFGTGTITESNASGYLFDLNHQAIPSGELHTGSGSFVIEDESVIYGPGAFIPPASGFAADIYGAHIEIPLSGEFELTGGRWVLAGGVGDRNRYSIGNVPDSGATVGLFALALLPLLTWGATRQLQSRRDARRWAKMRETAAAANAPGEAWDYQPRMRRAKAP